MLDRPALKQLCQALFCRCITSLLFCGIVQTKIPGNLHWGQMIIHTMVYLWPGGVITTSTSNGSWCMGIKGEMSGTVCVTFTWDMYIYMSCLYPLFLLLFVHHCNLMVYVVFWVGKWQSRGSTGMFDNLMAIYHIMLQFIQNHSRFVMLMIWK